MIHREKLRLYSSFKHKETTISRKTMPSKHVAKLKSQIKNYNGDSCQVSSAIWTSTGQEIAFSVLQGLRW